MDMLEKPTNELLDKYISIFQNDKRYSSGEKAITKLFSAFPNNKKLEDILLKISVINDLYSTNILDKFKLAEHIQNLNIDNELEIGNPEVVNAIAKGHGIKTKKTIRNSLSIPLQPNIVIGTIKKVMQFTTVL